MTGDEDRALLVISNIVGSTVEYRTSDQPMSAGAR